MKRIKFLALTLVVLVGFAYIAIGADQKPVKIDKMLKQFNLPYLSTIQRNATIESYYGKTISGTGRVYDVLDAFNEPGWTNIYVKKTFRGAFKKYELVLKVPREEGEKIYKNQWIRYEARFVRLVIPGSLRFDNVKIFKRSGWWSL